MLQSRNAVLFMLAFILTGCASTANFNNTPRSDAEFRKSIIDLKRDYSDVEKYDRAFADPSEAPSVSELVSLWGEPATETRWVWFVSNFALGAAASVVGFGYVSLPIMASTFLMAPIPQEKYVWHKGAYEIVASGRNDLFTGYEKRIARWEWTESRANDGNVALNSQSSGESGK